MDGRILFHAKGAELPAKYHVLVDQSNTIDPPGREFTPARLERLFAEYPKPNHAIKAFLPMARTKSMDQLLDESLAGNRLAAVLMTTFASMALLLAAVGIYGVMSFAVAQRTHEIGLRMALGAGRAGVVGLVFKEGMTTALVGTVLGLLGAYGLGKVLQGIWSDVGHADPRVLGAVALLLLGTAMVACFIPARRAASVDPMVALRQD